MRPKPGELLRVDGRASVQFAGERALTLRVLSVCDRPTYAGWLWLTGYVMNRAGQATARREVYVQLAGLHRHAPLAHPRAGSATPEYPPLRETSRRHPGCEVESRWHQERHQLHESQAP